MRQQRQTARRVAAALLVAGSLASCGGGEAPPRNVLLISIDSLRADRLGCYGNARETSPTLDRLAAEGARFARAYSPTSWTLPSHATLLTGLSMAGHGAVRHDRGILRGVDSLATTLSRRGYRTLGVYSGPFLDPRYGFERGFDEYASCQGYDDRSPRAIIRSHSDRTNDCLASRVEGWARQTDERPFFWFVHMWDPHFDYIPPPEYVRRFDPNYRGVLDGRKITSAGFPVADASTRDVAHLLARYDGEIRAVDDTIASMLDAMRERNLLDDTLVVVTADHGEEFREHGGKGHKRTVHAESVHVPLILWGPGVPAGRIVDTPVGLADVAPTILDLLGAAAPAMDGTSLHDLLHGVTTDHPPVVSLLYGPEWVGAKQLWPTTLAVRDRTSTVLRSSARAGWVQFDPVLDPYEQIPMVVTDPALRKHAVAAVAQARLERARGRNAPSVRIDRATRSRLKALGYVE